MIGLIILLIVAVYISLWVLVTVVAYRFTLKGTQSKKKSYMVAGVFFMVMYLIPFWDLIPTLVAHRYYCNTQAGFWVYKTPEEWMAENPDVVIASKNHNESKIQYFNSGFRYDINNRIYYEFHRDSNISHSISREERLLKDNFDNSVIARKVEFLFGSGMASIHSGGSLKEWRKFLVFGWFENRYCGDRIDSYDEPFRKIENKFYLMGDVK